MDNDGYYYRNERGTSLGPFDKKEFDELRERGTLKPGVKAWRQKGASYFQIHVGRRYTIGTIFSAAACGHCAELSMMALVLVGLFAVIRAPKMQQEFHKDHFIAAMLLLCVLVALFSIRMHFKRLSTSSSEIIALEPPV